MSKFLEWFNKDKNQAPKTEENQTAETQESSESMNASEELEVNSDSSAPAESQVQNNIEAPAAEFADKNNQDDSTEEAADQEENASEENKENFFDRLKRGLAKTGDSIGAGMANLFLGKQIDDDLFEELETQLLMADIGIETTSKIIDELTDMASRSQLKNADEMYPVLKQHLAELLTPITSDFVPENSEGPFVILMVGVNGVGKTTTIGKMAKQFQQQGKSVMLAAGDTFRAAAVEQLQVWGERNDIPVIAQHTGADSASVLFDALQSAKAKNADILIADTAGRLQNKDHLMEELKKVVRVMKKLDVDAPHEIMLTLDAGTGQNAISQMQLFSDAVGVTGISLTKLDGTAKGGVIFALADKFNVPVRFIGVGEGINDLQPFDGKTFVDALFQQE